MRELIEKELKTVWAGRKCLYFDALPSTNDYGKELAKKQPVHGTLIIAEEQTAGKGRRGRSWQSEKGTNIALSICINPTISSEKVSGVTLAAALAAAEAVYEVSGIQPEIKWPNDLVYHGRKICGILTELTFSKGVPALVIGMGFNVNNESFSEEIQNTATSIKLAAGYEISREKLIASVMNHFEELYEKYEKTEDLTLLKDRYESMLVNRGREVRVLDPTEPFVGIAKGITSAGNLVVVCEDGSEREVYSGEVSVRGIFGYV